MIKNARAAARHAALAAIGRSRLVAETALPDKADIHLYTHRLGPAGTNGLERAIDVYEAHGSFVPYAASLLHGPAASGVRLTMSFDDGFASNLEAGEVLAQRGISACFFVCTGIVGEKDPSRVASFFGSPQPELPMDWSELERLRELGHEIGSHCVEHRPLSSASSEAEVDQQLGESHDAIAARLGECKHFAWPFGRFHHVPADVCTAVERAGYLTIASAERGCHAVSGSRNPFDDRVVLRNQFEASDGRSIQRAMLVLAARRVVGSVAAQP